MVDDGATQVHVVDAYMRKLGFVQTVKQVLISAFQGRQAIALTEKTGSLYVSATGFVGTIQKNHTGGGSFIKPDTGFVFFSFAVHQLKMGEAGFHRLR